MANSEKLQKMQAILAKKKGSSNKTYFDKLQVCYLGVPLKEHFPKLKAEDGSNIKDENGRDKRSDSRDGYVVTCSEIGTSQIVEVVIPRAVKLELDEFYLISGKGYQIRSGNMIFIDEDGHISNFG